MSKRDILSILSEITDLDANTVAQQVASTPEAAGMALLRLSRQGLVRRVWDADDRVLYYALTTKGGARLLYWKERDDASRR